MLTISFVIAHSLCPGVNITWQPLMAGSRDIRGVEDCLRSRVVEEMLEEDMLIRRMRPK